MMNQSTPAKHASKSNIIAKLFIPVMALTILLVMVAWLAGSFDEKVAPQQQANSPSAHNQAQVFTVSQHIEKANEAVAASVEAKQATIISSRILARIEKIFIRAGDTVKKGDKLIQLEQHELQSQVLQARQSVKAIDARHKEAKQNYQRTIELFKAKLVSEFELDKSRADFKSIDAELTASKQVLSQAETTLSYANLTAPIDGRIVDRFAEPGDTTQPGSKLLSLYNPLSLRVEAYVRETLALTLRQHQTITIELPTLSKTIAGSVEEIVPAANTGSRSFLIKVRINSFERLLPGMYARLLIPTQEQVILTIPQNSVTQVGQLNFVQLISDGQTQRRYIRLGKKYPNNMVSVISGLNRGDKILTVPELNK